MNYIEIKVTFKPKSYDKSISRLNIQVMEKTSIEMCAQNQLNNCII